MPRSAVFDDVYFSAEDGRAETQHVFIEGNKLPARWQGAQRFTITETGFGSGLNFLHTWHAWQQQAEASAKLHYIAVERYPMRRQDIYKAMAPWPELQLYAEQLIAQYPPLIPGFHVLYFGNVELLLLWGDVAELLPQLNAHVDAWYLDGFAPGKNTHMWDEALWEQMARLSSNATTVATFTAAGTVRRGLEAAGFAMQKVAGFGRKRDMLVGEYGLGDTGRMVCGNTQKVIVIGAGIAGCSTARALAERGFDVTVIERHEGIAHGATGNTAGVLFPQPAQQWTSAAQWSFIAYAYMQRMLPRWQAECDEILYGQPGMLKLPKSERQRAQCEPIAENLGMDPLVAQWLSKEAAEDKVGMNVPSGGLWYAKGTWVKPILLCAQLLTHDAIEVVCNMEAISLKQSDNGWCVHMSDQTLRADNVIMCNATDANAFEQIQHLPLMWNRGQWSLLPKESVVTTIKAIICHEGVVIPQDEGDYIIGSTYNRGDVDITLRKQDHDTNIEQLRTYLPEFLHNGDVNIQTGRVGLRSESKDRMPLIGPVTNKAGDAYTGLYCSVGHGSRGLLSAPLGAEVLASMISATAFPVPRAVLGMLEPRRFS